jgi:hypothetical protein
LNLYIKIVESWIEKGNEFAPTSRGIAIRERQIGNLYLIIKEKGFLPRSFKLFTKLPSHEIHIYWNCHRQVKTFQFRQSRAGLLPPIPTTYFSLALRAGPRHSIPTSRCSREEHRSTDPHDGRGSAGHPHGRGCGESAHDGRGSVGHPHGRGGGERRSEEEGLRHEPHRFGGEGGGPWQKKTAADATVAIDRCLQFH